MHAETLLIRLEGPVQGWGDSGSRWDYRTTNMRPTKSGVLGLVANALGRTFTDPIDDLAALRFGVRADRPGHVEYDFRTAGGGTFPLDAKTRWANPSLTADGSGRINYGAPRGTGSWTRSSRQATPRHMTYLADAGFVAALTGPAHTVTHVWEALHQPHRLLSLGRRANPPSHPLAHTLLDGDRHSTWADTVALLDTYTRAQPAVWLEHPNGDLHYEQPYTGRQRGGYTRPILLRTYRTTPPAPTTDHKVL